MTGMLNFRYDHRRTLGYSRHINAGRTNRSLTQREYEKSVETYSTFHGHHTPLEVSLNFNVKAFRPVSTMRRQSRLRSARTARLNGPFIHIRHQAHLAVIAPGCPCSEQVQRPGVLFILDRSFVRLAPQSED
jgi:hypothetical protein